VGRREAKTVASTSTQFLYDGANPIQELSGTTVTANILTGLGIDEYLMRNEGASGHHYLADALGSTIRLTDNSAAKLVDYTYAPYGKSSADAGSTNAFQFTGRENDGTGLNYYRARYQHPVLGAFISEDPIGLVGGENLYAYVRGVPTLSTDPSGLLSIVAGGGAAGVIGIAGTQGTAELEGGSGGYYNFESGEAGAYSTAGGGVAGTATYNNGESSPANYGGVYGGFGPTVALIGGSAQNVAGRTQNLYVQVPMLPGIVVFFGPNNAFLGVGITLGPGIGAGVTQTNTRTFPFRSPRCQSSICCR
jgi:RHS repeat-associated protein